MAFALPRPPCSPVLPFWRSWYPCTPSAPGTGTYGGGSDHHVRHGESLHHHPLSCSSKFPQDSWRCWGAWGTSSPLQKIQGRSTVTLRTPSCYSHMHKFSCCKSLELWRREFEGPGPKLCQFMLTLDQPWNLTKASMFMQVLGKAVGATSCAFSIPSSRTAAGTTQQQPQHVSSGKQTQTQELKAKPPWNIRKP